MNFNFITAVWGPAYTELYLRVVLPNQLTPGNLLAIADRGKPVYRVYTGSADAEVIRASAVWKALEALMETEICEVDNILEGHLKPDKYGTMTACHRLGILASLRDTESVLIFPPADVLFSEGTFARLYELAQAGKRVVMLAGVRLLKETVVPAYLERYARSDQIGIPIGSRELVALALEHLHPISKAMLWDSPSFITFPSAFYWLVGNEGIIERAFHLHPVMVHPLVRDALPVNTIDGDYLTRSCPNFSDVHVVTTSDEMVVYELSPQTHCDHIPLKDGQLIPHRANIEEVAKFIGPYSDSYHRRFARHEIRHVATEPSQIWDPVSREAEHVIESSFELFERMSQGGTEQPEAGAKRDAASVLRRVKRRVGRMVGRRSD